MKTNDNPIPSKFKTNVNQTENVGFIALKGRLIKDVTPLTTRPPSVASQNFGQCTWQGAGGWKMQKRHV